MPQQFAKASLNSLANIRSGHPFREKIEYDNAGDVRVLQIRDLRLESAFNAADLPLIKMPKGGATLLASGDVVIPARGEHYQAVSFASSEPTLASSQLLTLRVTSDKVLPGYLCWALNQPVAQHTLRNESRGTNMPLLSRQSLSAVRLTVPPLDTQHKIVELQKLWEKEQQLTQQLLNNRETMLKGMFHQLLFHTANHTSQSAAQDKFEENQND